MFGYGIYAVNNLSGKLMRLHSTGLTLPYLF